MSPVHQLRAALDRAKLRVENCRRERDRFEVTLDADDDHAQRIWRKLDEDLKKAERDAGYAAFALTTALAEGDSAFRRGA